MSNVYFTNSRPSIEGYPPNWAPDVPPANPSVDGGENRRVFVMFGIIQLASGLVPTLPVGIASPNEMAYALIALCAWTSLTGIVGFVKGCYVPQTRSTPPAPSRHVFLRFYISMVCGVVFLSVAALVHGFVMIGKVDVPNYDLTRMISVISVLFGFLILLTELTHTAILLRILKTRTMGTHRVVFITGSGQLAAVYPSQAAYPVCSPFNVPPPYDSLHASDLTPTACPLESVGTRQDSMHVMAANPSPPTDPVSNMSNRKF